MVFFCFGKSNCPDYFLYQNLCQSNENELVVVTAEKEGRCMWTSTLSRRKIVSGLSWGEIRKGEQDENQSCIENEHTSYAYYKAYSHEAEQGDLIMKNVGDKDDPENRQSWRAEVILV